MLHVYTVQGLIFVVDSNDRERINEARDELYKMVSVVYLCTFMNIRYERVCEREGEAWGEMMWLCTDIVRHSITTL